jgi:hypothetical protein
VSKRKVDVSMRQLQKRAGAFLPAPKPGHH